jgi:C4-type Zn-finger protein
MDVDQQRFEAWWEKWKPGECPVCHTENWAAAERVFQMSNLGFAGNMVPVLLIGCETCGYLLPIHATVAEVMPDQEAAEEPPPGAEEH